MFRKFTLRNSCFCCLAAVVVSFILSGTANATVVAIRLTDTIGTANTPGIVVGETVTFDVFADNGGSSILNQTWTLSNISYFTVRAGSYLASYSTPYPSGSGFSTDALGNVSSVQFYGTSSTSHNTDNFSDLFVGDYLLSSGEFYDSLNRFNAIANLADFLDTSHWTVTQVAAVPELSTWAMMLLGFAGMGFVAYRRKAKPALMAAFLLGLANFPVSQARADVQLSFTATYDTLYVYRGPTAYMDTSFTPFNYSFSVYFDPALIGTSGPTFSTSSAGTSVTANTLFGPPTFSSSPVSLALRQLVGGNLSSSYTSASENEGYDAISGGYRAVSLGSGGQNNSGMYYFTAGTYVGGVPAAPNDVGHITSQTLLGYLATAQNQSLAWYIDEGGIANEFQNFDQRVGYDYRGIAVLTSISGVPEPSTWAMMILGFAGIGFMGYRRRMNPLTSKSAVGAT